MVEIVRVSNEKELEAIRLLQRENLRVLIGEEEAGKEGFLTAEYTMETLQKMHQLEPSIIAKDGDKIAGYVIVTTKESYGQHPLLDSLFDSIDALTYNGSSLKDVNYILVGQLCVGKAYRGIGLVQKMYTYYQESLSNKYQYLITDVAQENPRSIKAHLKTGFEIIDTLKYGGIGWDIVLWDWRK
jgi:ribosomal protein S18 acetylase RimI-like enzyme